MDRRNRHLHSDDPPSLFLPIELVAEILSLLDVKTIMKFKLVSNSWKSLISDQTFVQMHLKKSSQNPHLTVIWREYSACCSGFIVSSFPFRRLIESPFINFHTEKFNYWNGFHIAGSCNGLICVVSKLLCSENTVSYQHYSIYSWNPAIKSEKFESFRYIVPQIQHGHLISFNFAFGYDDSSKTYKVVAFHVINLNVYDPMKLKSVVLIFSLGGDNSWRNIDSFPVIPLMPRSPDHYCNNGLHLNGTVNWLAIREHLINHVDQFVIVSLDLSTETYKELLLPQGFDVVPCIEPVLKVLMGSLCFSHDYKETEFVLWQMKDERVWGSRVLDSTA